MVGAGSPAVLLANSVVVGAASASVLLGALLGSSVVVKSSLCVLLANSVVVRATSACMLLEALLGATCAQLGSSVVVRSSPGVLLTKSIVVTSTTSSCVLLGATCVLLGAISPCMLLANSIVRKELEAAVRSLDVNVEESWALLSRLVV